MCKPTILRKVILGAAVFIFVSSTQVAGGITVWGGVEAKNVEFMQAGEDYDADLVGLAIIALGGLMGIVAILGCLGTWFRIRWCLGIVSYRQFCTLVCWMGMILMASGAGALYFQGYLNDQLTRNSCDTVEVFQEAENASQLGSSLICTYLCPCSFDASLQALYVPYNRAFFAGSASGIQDCIPCEGLSATSLTRPELQSVNDFLSPYGLNLETCLALSHDDFMDRFFTRKGRLARPLLTWMEATMDCSGMCTASYIYSFSDVNNGDPDLPTKPCYMKLNDWVDDKLPVFGGLGVSFGAVLMLVAVLTVLFCCHPNRQGDK